MNPVEAPSDIPALERAEVALGQDIADLRETPTVRVAARFAKLGDQEPMYALAASLVALGLVARRPLLVHAGLRAGAAIAVSDLSKRLIKRLYTRSRPHAAVADGSYRRNAGEAEDKRDQSFPSGHMAATVAAVCAIDRVYPGARPIGALAAVALGVTRVAQGQHWPSDVAAGAVVGAMAERLTRVVLDRALADLELRA